MNPWKEIEIVVTRPVIDVSRFAGPDEYMLGQPRTRGTATGTCEGRTILTAGRIVHSP
jgi:hypothetical protein